MTVDNLMKENETARASLELLYHISRELTSALDLRTVLQRVLLLSVQNVGAINGSIIVLDDNEQPIDSAIIVNGDFKNLPTSQLTITFLHGLSGWVARNQEAALLPDTSLDNRWMRRPDDAENRTGPKSAVSAPLMARDKLIGVMTLVHPQTNFFGVDHLNLVQAIADQAGTAIHHAQLFERMVAAHQRYRELFEDSIDPILVTDWQGRIIEANRQAEVTINLERDAFRNLALDSLHVVNRDEVGNDFVNLASGKTISYEANLLVQGGREIPVQVHARKVQIEGVPHLQWILRDITERKNLDKLRTDLLSMVYHDLRSPLANVVSSLDVLATMLPASADKGLKSLLNIAVRSTERIQRLTDSLLDIDRLEAGQEVGNRQSVDPHTLFNDALDAVSPIAQNKKIKIETAIPAELSQVFVDADMIRRVLINLIENAVKFSPARGKIYLSALNEEMFVQMSVRDTGPGIPPSEHQRIFEKFSRLHAEDGSRGLGLGLAYCRMAVKGHGGQIWVESEPGEGSSFNFTLPIAKGTQ